MRTYNQDSVEPKKMKKEVREAATERRMKGKPKQSLGERSLNWSREGRMTDLATERKSRNAPDVFEKYSKSFETDDYKIASMAIQYG